MERRIFRFLRWHRRRADDDEEHGEEEEEEEEDSDANMDEAGKCI